MRVRMRYDPKGAASSAGGGDPVAAANLPACLRAHCAYQGGGTLA